MRFKMVQTLKYLTVDVLLEENEDFTKKYIKKCKMDVNYNKK